jgi:hypothetical protein
LQIKAKIFGCHTADSKPAKQEVNSTVILPSLVFPGKDISDIAMILPTFSPTHFANINTA